MSILQQKLRRWSHRPGAGWTKQGVVGDSRDSSRDQTGLRVVLASEEAYISKALGGRPSPGAGKEGWPGVVLSKGGVAVATSGPEVYAWTRLGPGGKNSAPHHQAFPMNSTSACSQQQIPSKTSSEWKGTWHNAWRLSHSLGPLASPYSLCGKTRVTWDLPLPVLSLPFQPRHLENFSN